MAVSKAPRQTCQHCGDSEDCRLDGRGGFPPDAALRKLTKRCKDKGHKCDPTYTAGLIFRG